jgi:hypothetical protein
MFTVWVNTEDVLPLSFESPPYEAVIECGPATSFEVLNVAFPAPTVPVPSVVLPSMKVTVPVAVEGVTEAVKVTEEPYNDGLTGEVSATVAPT